MHTWHGGRAEGGSGGGNGASVRVCSEKGKVGCKEGQKPCRERVVRVREGRVVYGGGRKGMGEEKDDID